MTMILFALTVRICVAYFMQNSIHISTHQHETCRYCTKDKITYDFELF